MCNAWNHSPDCTCGWGGEGHKGKKTLNLNDSYSILSVSKFKFEKSNPISYTNPNALCPICNKKVFFFKSENGGCAYFDELGPPWPKHPCMDQIKMNSVKVKFYNIFNLDPKVKKNHFNSLVKIENISLLEKWETILNNYKLLTFSNLITREQILCFAKIDEIFLLNSIFNLKEIEKSKIEIECLNIDENNNLSNFKVIGKTPKNHFRLGELARKSSMPIEKLIRIINSNFGITISSENPAIKVSGLIGEKILLKLYKP